MSKSMAPAHEPYICYGVEFYKGGAMAPQVVEEGRACFFDEPIVSDEPLDHFVKIDTDSTDAPVLTIELWRRGQQLELVWQHVLDPTKVNTLDDIRPLYHPRRARGRQH